MKVFKEDKKQQERLAAFYKEETTYFPNHVLLNFVAGFMTFVSFFINIIPCLDYGDGFIKVDIYACLLFSIGISTYASKYAAFTEPLTKKVRNIVDVTKYLPVNRMQLTIFRIKPLSRSFQNLKTSYQKGNITTGLTKTVQVMIAIPDMRC